MKAVRILIVAVLAVALTALSVGCCSYRVPDTSDVLHGFGSSPHRKLPDTLSVVVWNLHKGQLSGWQDDVLRLGKGADLLILQEAVTTERMLRTLHDLPGVQWSFAASFGYLDGGYATGVLTGSRAMPMAVDYVRSEAREPIVGTPKVALLTLYALNAHPQPLLVINVHGHLAVSAETFAVQMEEITMRAAKHRGPVLWAGDFNTWTDERYQSVRQLASWLRLTEVAITPDHRTNWLGNVLDRAFVRGLEFHSARALPKVQSSDHVPFALELKLSVPAPTPIEAQYLHRQGPINTARSIEREIL
jgi:endonuclease/exonuclease/phosphatase (EEP) superfamily protein YafD